jgi:hypothetical protein
MKRTVFKPGGRSAGIRNATPTHLPGQKFSLDWVARFALVVVEGDLDLFFGQVGVLRSGGKYLVAAVTHDGQRVLRSYDLIAAVSYTISRTTFGR